ncbi:MAG: tetratricopeptide repeat protein, partial [Caldiserica bacterium]|nr:tetratricopeptide repeat protein [Caldisericota bacterium]
LAKKSKGSKRWEYLLTLGNFYQKQGDKTKALLTFQDLAREATGKEKYEALLKIGAIYLGKEEFEKAKEVFTGIEKAYSGEVKRKAALGLGDIYFYQGEFEKAESIYKKATKEKPSHPEGYYLQRAEYYLKLKDKEKLKSTLREWGEEYPISRLKFIPYYRGWVYWLARDYNKAKREWRLLKEYGKSPLQEKVSKLVNGK